MGRIELDKTKMSGYALSTMDSQAHEQPDRMLTTQEAAEVLRLSTKTLRLLARKGVVPSVRVGGQWRFSAEAVEKFTQNGKN